METPDMGLLETIDAKLDKSLEQLESGGGSTPEPEKEEKPKQSRSRSTTKKTTSRRGKKAVSLDDVKDAARSVLKVDAGKDKLVELLEEYDVEKVVELGEGDYAEFVKKCTAVVEDEGGEDDDDFDI